MSRNKHVFAFISSLLLSTGCSSTNPDFSDYVFYDGFYSYNAYGQKKEQILPNSFEYEGKTYYKDGFGAENTVSHNGKCYLGYRTIREDNSTREYYDVVTYDYEKKEISHNIIEGYGPAKSNPYFGLSFGDEIPFRYHNYSSLVSSWSHNNKIHAPCTYPLAITDNLYYSICYIPETQDCDITVVKPLDKVDEVYPKYSNPFFAIKMIGSDDVLLKDYIQDCSRLSGFARDEEEGTFIVYLQPNTGFWCDYLLKIDLLSRSFEVLNGKFCLSNTLPKLSNIKDYSLHQRYQDCSPEFVYYSKEDVGHITNFRDMDFELDVSTLGAYTEFSGAFNYIQSLNSLFFEMKDPVTGNRVDVLMNIEEKIPHITPIGLAHKGNKEKKESFEVKVFEDEKYAFYSVHETDGLVKFIAKNRSDGRETTLQKKRKKTNSLLFETKNNRFDFDYIYDYASSIRDEPNS